MVTAMDNRSSYSSRTPWEVPWRNICQRIKAEAFVHQVLSASGRGLSLELLILLHSAHTLTEQAPANSIIERAPVQKPKTRDTCLNADTTSRKFYQSLHWTVHPDQGWTQRWVQKNAIWGTRGVYYKQLILSWSPNDKPYSVKSQGYAMT